MDDSSSRFIEDHPLAPIRAIPSCSLLSIEYPGYIISPAAAGRAISTLGGPAQIERLCSLSLSGRDSLKDNDAFRPELNFGRTGEGTHVESRWKRPINGAFMQGDKLVLRVRKRTKVKVYVDAEGTKRKIKLDKGEFMVDVVGPVAKTIKFRAIADHQYRPDPTTSESKLRDALTSLDYKMLAKFEWPAETETYTQPKTKDPDDMDATSGEDGDYSSDETDRARTAYEEKNTVSVCHLFPPPLFTSQIAPHKYHYKANPMSTITRAEHDETRLINKTRKKPLYVTSVNWKLDQPTPTHPPAGLSKIDKALVDRITKLFADEGTYPGIVSRPAWSRIALANQLSDLGTDHAVRTILKPLLPFIAYTFSGGAFRDLFIRFGYDPRKIPESKIYQSARLRVGSESRSRATRSLKTHPNQRALTVAGKTAGVLQGGDSRKTHIFDGQKLHKDWSNFQLCDITDPELVKLIHDPAGVREKCYGDDGWYKPIRQRLIREVVRMKFSSLLKRGVPLPPGACDQMIEGGLAEERASNIKAREKRGRGELEDEEEEDHHYQHAYHHLNHEYDGDDHDEDSDSDAGGDDDDDDGHEDGGEGTVGHYGKSSSDSRYAFLSLTRKKGTSKSRHIYHGRNDKEIMAARLRKALGNSTQREP